MQRLLPDAAFAEVSRWLLSSGASPRPPETVFEGFFDRLLQAGLPLWRAATSVVSMHPEVFALNVVWKRGEAPQSILRPRDQDTNPEFLRSPIARVLQSGEPIRRRLAGASDDELEFDVLRALAAQGGTDYLILPLELRGGLRSFVSFATDDPQGFSEVGLAALRELAPLLALRLELEAEHLARRTLLKTYLGERAANRVLAGDVVRGKGTVLPAAVWCCDLRGFTAIADNVPVEQVVTMLDRYFDCAVGAIMDRGGEVLKFVGDAVIAIFPLDVRGPREACGAALEAAEAALDALARLEPVGGFPLQIGVGLHVGAVMFGNVGGRDRLDFTAIGSAVNEATRVESLCRSTGVPLLMTAPFAWECRRADIVSLGEYSLRGVARKMEIATIARFVTR